IMSRAYRVKVKESLKRTIKAEDSVSTGLEILEVLPAEQMSELLAEELKAHGFEEQEDGTLTRQQGGGLNGTANPCSGEVTVKAETKADVELEAQREGIAYDDVGPGSKAVKGRLEQEAKQDLERQAGQRQEALQQEATGRLERELQGMTEEL